MQLIFLINLNMNALFACMSVKISNKSLEYIFITVVQCGIQSIHLYHEVMYLLTAFCALAFTVKKYLPVIYQPCIKVL